MKIEKFCIIFNFLNYWFIIYNFYLVYYVVFKIRKENCYVKYELVCCFKDRL